MKKIRIIVLVLLLLIITTGCNSDGDKNLSKVIKNTSITEKGLTSYRVKVRIIGNNIDENYIVLNKKNKEYDITLFKGNQILYITEKKEKKTIVDQDNSEYTKKLKYNYKNTDIFLEGLVPSDKKIKSSVIELAGKKYTKYDFKVSKDVLNKMLKGFNISTKIDGNAYVYVDKNNHAYIVNYDFDKVSIDVSYTRLNGIK